MEATDFLPGPVGKSERRQHRLSRVGEGSSRSVEIEEGGQGAEELRNRRESRRTSAQQVIPSYTAHAALFPIHHVRSTEVVGQGVRKGGESLQQ